MKPRAITIDGERIAYPGAGTGPVLLLVHGMAGSSLTWTHVMPALAKRFTILAPDLLGQGQSDKPRGDYSLGAHANTLRDLLDALGYARGTVVGQSLGGGVAMQFAYQFPERCERLVLVNSGGLGREVTVYLGRDQGQELRGRVDTRLLVGAGRWPDRGQIQDRWQGYLPGGRRISGIFGKYVRGGPSPPPHRRCAGTLFQRAAVEVLLAIYETTRARRRYQPRTARTKTPTTARHRVWSKASR